MDSKYKQDSQQQNTVEISPSDTISFAYDPKRKKILAEVEIHNRTQQDIIFRVKTQAPQFYFIKPKNENEYVVTAAFSQKIEIRMECDESRLQHRLKDRFRIEIVEKQKFDAAPSEESRWNQLLKQVILNVSLIRKGASVNLQKSQLMSVKSQIVATQSYFVQSKFIPNSISPQPAQQQQDYSQNEDIRNFKQKVEALKQKYMEQEKLIEQYKFDINELQNEIDKNAFIYDLERKQLLKEEQPEQNIVLAIRDKTGIPLWELFLAATIAVIIGAILN